MDCLSLEDVTANVESRDCYVFAIRLIFCIQHKMKISMLVKLKSLTLVVMISEHV